MADKLCFLVCNHFKAEVTAVIEAKNFNSVTVAAFPGDCGSPPTEWNNLKQIIHAHSDCQEIHILGNNCITQFNVAPEAIPHIHFHKTDHPFGMVTSASMVNHHLQQKAYLLTPGWLKNWRQQIKRWGFDQATAQDFFNEFARSLVLLDTGINEKSSELLQEFASFVNLPFEIVPVGLDYLSLYLTNIVQRWRLEREREKTAVSLNNAQRQIADYAMSSDLLNGLIQTLTEPETIGTMLDLFYMLFAPDKLCYLSIEDGKPGEIQTCAKNRIDNETYRKRLLEFDGPYAWSESGTGFFLKISSRDELLGILTVDEIAFPEYKQHYLNLALTIVNVCGLAIDHARTYQQVKQAEKALRQYANEQAALYTVSQIFLEQVEVDDILATACQLAVKHFGLKMAWIGLVSKDHVEVHPADSYGFEKGWLASIRVTWDDTPVGQGPTGTSIRTKQPVAMNHIETDPAYVSWRVFALQWGYRSSAAFPLIYNGQVLATLNLYSIEPDYFVNDRLQLLQSFVNQAAIALQKARLYGQVQGYATELEQRVASRTAELTVSNELLRQEIAERKRTESELRRGEARYRQMFETNQAIKLIVDPENGRIMEANDAASVFYGYDSETLTSMTIMDINILSDDDVRGELDRAKGNEKLYFDFRHRLASGEVRDVEVYSGPIGTESRVQLYSIIHDVTARKEAEIALFQLNMELEQRISDRTNDLNDTVVELRHAKEAAETANRAKSAFLGNMSHELRTPLNIILAYTQLMRRETAVYPSQSHLQTIEDSGVHLLELINELLESSKIEANRAALSESTFDLYQQLASLESMFAVSAQNKAVQLTFDKAPDLPRYIYTDSRKLYQILINLLGNAIKFTDNGQVTLTAGMKASSTEWNGRDDDHAVVLQFAISDTGAGVTPDEMEALFIPFRQTASGVATQTGTGLGLSISRAYAQLMGGDITVESKLGEGSVFTVEIAVTAVSPPAETITASSHEPYENVIALLPGQDEFRLLVVDDNEASRFALQELLGGIGFVVHTAVNGEEAIAEWEAWRPHLIWMDKRMPVMDGQEATRRIKRSPGGQETIVIALTGSILGDIETICETMDCDDFVSKPFQMVELLEKMEQHLGVQYAYQEPVEVLVTQSNMNLTREDLLLFPEKWRKALHNAIVQGRTDRAFVIIDEIRPAQPEVAEVLMVFIEDFRFDELIALTEVE